MKFRQVYRCSGKVPQLRKAVRATQDRSREGGHSLHGVQRPSSIDPCAADLKQIALQLQHFDKQLDAPVVFEMVLRSNGNLYASWEEHERSMRQNFEE